MCGGPSQSQQSIANSQQNFMNTLQNNYGQVFAGQQNILNSLQNAFNPIVAAGINQYGYSPAENAALNSEAVSGNAQQFSNATRSLNEQIAAQGGGNTVLPSGANTQLQANLAAQQAATSSQEQLGITTAGYEQGRQNFLAATGGLGGVAQQLNPTSYAGQATNAGNSAFSSATTNYNEGQVPWGAIGGLLGGVAGAALGNPSGLLSSFGGGGGGGGGGGVSGFGPTAPGSATGLGSQGGWDPGGSGAFSEDSGGGSTEW